MAVLGSVLIVGVEQWKLQGGCVVVLALESTQVFGKLGAVVRLLTRLI